MTPPARGEAAARPFTVLVATDGSPQARAAVAGTVAFPWPEGTRVHGVIATGGTITGGWSAPVKLALDRVLADLAERARDALAARWSDADVRLADAPPAEAILAEARRVRADAIVLGSRERGAIGRLLLGSVSRDVVRDAATSVLVVRGRRRAFDRIVMGTDGSPHARRALGFLARLGPARGRRVTVVRVVEPLRPPSAGPLPATARSAIVTEVRALNARRLEEARKELRAAAEDLGAGGFTVRTAVARGVPADELLRTASAVDADLLVIGARGVGGVERLLLGSVADAVVNRAPMSVLVVR